VILHPSNETLRAFGDGTLPDLRRTRVARHLAACGRCRTLIARTREIVDAVGEATAPPLPSGGWERIAARRRQGETVLLPVAEPYAAPTQHRFRVAAVAAVLLVGLAAVLLRTAPLQAEHSELRFNPSAPLSGQAVHVTYHAGTLLAGAPRLVLRARFHAADAAGIGEPDPVTVAELGRGRDGLYTGTFVLPAGAVYAVFAVEDETAERVDHAGETWELLVSGPDGVPLSDAFARQIDALRQRDFARAREAADRYVQAYPESLHAVMEDYVNGDGDDAEAAAARVEHNRRMRAAVAARLDAAGRLTADDLDRLMRMAQWTGDAEEHVAWRARLEREAPDHAGAVQYRVFDAAAGGDPALEVMWQEGVRVPQLAFSGFMAASQQGDADAARRWGERLTAQHEPILATVANMIPATDAGRPIALDLARRALRWHQASGGARRPLLYGAGEWRRSLDRQRAPLLGRVGQALLAEGRTRAGLDTLELAVAATWDVSLYRTIGGVRLELGDTAGAAAVLARVAVDPSTSEAFADSAGQRLGRHAAPEAWGASLADARTALRDYATEGLINRRTPRSFRLVDGTGREQTVETSGGGPTVLVFWSRDCPPSRMQLPAVTRQLALLSEMGVRVITVTKEAPSAELSAFLEEGGHRFPVFHPDADRTVERAVGNRGVPHYFLLGRDGRVRYESHRPDDLARVASVLIEA
jgi:peroxiredoxin